MDLHPVTTQPQPDGGFIKDCGVSQDDVCSSSWMVWRDYTQMGNPLTEKLEGGFGETVNGTEFTLGFGLTSFIPPPQAPNIPVGTISQTTDNPCGIWISCQYGAFPIWLYNATDVTTNSGQVTTVNGLPSVTLNETFSNIQLDTGGHGDSTVNLVVSQQITGNATTMIAQVNVYADLSNMHFYLPDGTEIPQGTDYSLNLLWITGLSNGTESAQLGYFTAYPYTIIGNSLYFIVNGEVGNIAGITLSDKYVESQGANQMSSRQAQVQFISTNATVGAHRAPECLCLQTFPNLTYGVTTSVQSDPTIYMNHALMSTLPLITLIVVVAVVIAACVVLFRYRKRFRKGAKKINAET